MRLIITGGSLVAEFQNDPLAKVQQQLNTISQKSTLDIANLRSHIDKISELKDGKINNLIEEFQNRSQLENLELEELKTMIISLSKDKENNQGSLEISGLKDQLQDNVSKTKDIINRINDRIARIEKDGLERTKRFQEETTRINSENKKKIIALKQELAGVLANREKERKQEAVAKTKSYLPEHKAMKQVGVLDGRKYMGKLNFKPKLPI